MYVLQKEGQRTVRVARIGLTRSGDHYQPYFGTESSALEKLVQLEIESDN